VVRFWRAVELFSPQDIPAVKPAEQVYAVKPDRPLPWENPSRLPRLRPKNTWQHTVYCGVFAIERVRDVLGEVFPDAAAEDRDGRVRGDSALMAFTVNQDGLLLKDSISFSACAWAVGRTRSPGPDDPRWLEGFTDEAEYCERQMLDLGDGKLVVRGGSPRSGGPGSPGGLLATAGTLVADAVTGGVVSGLGGLVRGAVAEALGGAVGQAAQAAAGQTAESLARGVIGSVRGDESEGADGDSDVATRGEADAEGGEAGDGQGGAHASLPENLGTHPVTVQGIAAFTAWLAEHFGVTLDLAPDAARVRSAQVREDDADETVSPVFLNSMIAEDLERVEDEVAEGNAGQALARYLTGSDQIHADLRRDLREYPQEVLAGVAPEHIPLGRWPSAVSQPLALSQQFAVNRMLGELGRAEGVFSVNGPPGTGKTTMLRDVIAALVTQRACALAELRSPQRAFGASHTWRGEKYSRTVRELTPRLAGYAMVVASANNGAVQNITDEIPALNAIAEEWREEAAYLPDQATLMLNGAPAWGAIAARLGKAKNRNAFAQSFWWGKLSQEPTGGAARRTDTKQGLYHLLSGKTSQEQTGERPEEPVDWAEAVRRFTHARRTVERLRDARQRVAQALHDLPGMRRELRGFQRQAEALAASLPGLRQRAAEARDEMERSAQDERRHLDRRREHQAGQPRMLQSLFTGGRANRVWQEEYERLTADAERASRAVASARARLDAVSRELAAGQRLIEAGQERQRAVAALEETVRRARARWGDHVPDPADFTPDADRATIERRERSAPWADEEFAAARTRLFLEALRLHHAFLFAARQTMYKNLFAAIDVVSGDAPKDLPAGAVRAAWQNLFLTVPVVSTTFASCDRLFVGLGREDLGWLFVDEAGQAAPQQAVGALWRSRRAVIVGDPQQLEPVVVLPWTGQQRLREHHGVAQEWAPSWTSAQRVADRLMRWGTTLPAQLPDGSIEAWVGAPLRVHRRCDDPMFSISNEIAYNGLMVHGLSDRGDFRPPQESFWWDVRSSEANGKWVPAEGRALDMAVERLLGEGLPADELFVISPFRDVARRAGDLLRGRVARERIGTVHTAQGKESNVVILILGTAPEAVKSRRWAAEKPNLLNVAVSRAKRRVIIIGNHESWRGQRHFSVLARRLIAFPWEPSPPQSR
jgi:hypothetical protein